MRETQGPGRDYRPLDTLIQGVDHALRMLFSVPGPEARPAPGSQLPEPELSPEDRRRSIGYMRVNHAGEIAAQGLYDGQSLLARDPGLRATLRRAAAEEHDHLVWCAGRLRALGGRTSLLGPFWYAGACGIGALAGVAGDRWSLGFLAETERQVVRHLEGHLQSLPPADAPSRAVVAAMKSDEGHHASAARAAGGRELPWLVRLAMRLHAKVMTTTAYWI